MAREVLSALGLVGDQPGAWGAKALPQGGNAVVQSVSPIDGTNLGRVHAASAPQVEQIIAEARAAFTKWRLVPAPRRGEIVRQIGEALRAKKAELGALVSLEAGKIRAEGEGEIQEAIDIADFAVGLSRQLCGNTMHSERPGHRMYEQWHPLGIVGVITAFNFPAAVWAWNSMIAAVCGDVVLWKPSELTPLTAIAMHRIASDVAAKNGHAGIFQLAIGGPEIGELISAHRDIPVVSATGSCRMGKAVASTVAARFGRSILELGGNNAIIVMPDADLDLVIRATLFGAVGTAGQRCTTIRRALVHRDIEAEFVRRLSAAYAQISIGNPLQSGVLMGPLINQRAVDGYRGAIATARSQGAELVYGGDVVTGLPSSLYVQPTILRSKHTMPIVREEIFAPILHVIAVQSLDEAIALNNDVPQGLSSAIFTAGIRASEQFLSAAGSDCGIANVNIGTSGAEIGGAFGGEKETGGGREAGSDAWKQYMRRQTVTINYSTELPLAQGISFNVAK